MAQDYSWITDEMFEMKLSEIISNMSALELLTQVPGLYGEVREHFNNEVLQELESEREYCDCETPSCADGGEICLYCGHEVPTETCPVCGEEIWITGETTDGRLIGSCGDAFYRDCSCGGEEPCFYCGRWT